MMWNNYALDILKKEAELCEYLTAKKWFGYESFKMREFDRKSVCKPDTADRRTLYFNTFKVALGIKIRGVEF